MENTSTERRKGRIVGVDEAGRGAWAGPVVAAACVFLDLEAIKQSKICEKLSDSKILSETQRERLFCELKRLQEHGYIQFCVGRQSARMIDRHGIREANRRAMWQAIRDVYHEGDHVCIDGRDNYTFRSLSQAPDFIIRGDSKVSEIMAASIVAKVTRDRLMRTSSKRFSGYGFERHKGYGTKMHQSALQELGPCAIHRMSYQPILSLKT